MIYQEPKSYFSDNDREYDLNKIFNFTQNLIPIKMSTNKLKWILEHTLITLPNEEITCNSCQNEANPSLFHKKRVEQSDLNVPIIVLNEGTKFTIVDGLHRLEKTLLKKESNIFAIIIKQIDIDIAEVPTVLK
jgi:hypothetical protein